ncbi:hydantoinase/oxoprolinase family protein [Bordetella genomosp. 11]|uniref:5-oxoprolinase n=1 Tax=Bordetella genomosp. 11 TaxID=1416808 RepID=A0A261V0Z6_9BORD|nr:hydantoinase/oxoprolinase family protein [Bordetella genomosp. 11]OZI67272.1 5-oxoprolinase [Bordetella genomosp. 11]
MYRIGVDVGGTFTDLVLVHAESGRTVFHKVPSTPDDPSEAIHRGVTELIAENRLDPAEIRHIGHGTTVATNLVIERKGARCALITTKGFRDILDIGRQTRPHNFDYGVRKPEPLAPRRWRKEVRERVEASGAVLEPLDEEEVRRAARELKAEGVDAIAICYLHSYRNPAHEQRSRDIVREILPDAYICLSSEVLPEFREYERFSTTVLNAKVGPRMESYLANFLNRVKEAGVRQEPFTIHSNGGLMSVEAVRRFPVKTCLSGPAAGVVGAAMMGRAIGYPNLVTFDVGGTSTDVSLIANGQAMFSASRSVAGYPVKTPMVDIHVIGAGGGSLTWLDDAGSLKVGPQSAGAVPGPVGYGRGGEQPTLTDAQISLHRLNPQSVLDGKMPIHADAAKAALRERIAEPLGIGLEKAAEGVIRIANANMSRAIRAVSTERGYDLSEFALFAFGGAGPLHALGVARECGIPTVIVPPAPGNMCARGILLTDISFDFVASEIALVQAGNWPRIGDRFDGLRAAADRWLDDEQVPPADRRYQCFIDARYVGQNFEVQVPMEAVADDGLSRFEAAFHDAHRKEYGYDVPTRPIEIINCRMKAIGTIAKAPMALLADGGGDRPRGSREIHFGERHGWMPAAVYHRGDLAAGARLTGPAVIEEMSSTTVIEPEHSLTVDAYGNLIIDIA